MVQEKHQDFRPLIKLDLAVVWLREQEWHDEFRRIWSFDIVIAGIVISFIALVVAIIALYK